LLNALQKGDILLGDRAYGEYLTLASLPSQGIDVGGLSKIRFARTVWLGTMGMELLRCQSPDMAEKELMAYLVAYNLVRCLMAQVLALVGTELARLSSSMPYANISWPLKIAAGGATLVNYGKN
jgi:hypothetical protein